MLIKQILPWFLLCCAACGSSRNAGPGPGRVLQATALKAYGRYMFNNRQQLELIGSASHTGYSFEGRESEVYISLGNAGAHSYLQYELDGVYQARLRIDGGDPHPITIKARAGGKHTVWLYKTGEAMTGPLFIDKITGRNPQAIRKPPMPLIEFIGNSITCGAAADTSGMPCSVGEYQDHHNAYHAYGPRVARAVGAEWMLSSVSGIGIYRNWNSDGPAMPQVYEKADFDAAGHRLWDFELFTPKVVSIALGTNDFSNGDGTKARLPFDSTAFVSHYIAFAETVGQKYPLAQIVLLSSPMLQGHAKALLENCLRTVKQRIDALHPLDKPVVVHFFKPMQPRGCSGHPSVEDHAVLAEELIPLFKALLR